MSQHFLLSPAARTLSLRDIMRMSDEHAHARFVAIRFAGNNGAPFCPHCGVLKVYTFDRPRKRNRPVLFCNPLGGISVMMNCQPQLLAGS
jgi:hypothetical protein